ncbi:MAG: UbiA family prenyltransferase [Planctomycetota bacterium]|jgi:4-hydroxybenzoate polyprenyltransferase
MTFVLDVLSILRFHIIGVAVTATLVFGWLMSQQTFFGLALVVGLDWMLINLINKTTDLKEDAKNQIRGTGRIERHQRAFTAFAWLVLLGSFPLVHLAYPALLVMRVLVQLIGLGYSYRIVPTLKGLKRFKDLYFFKNFMSAVLFCMTCFGYPLLHTGGVTSGLPGGAQAVVLLILFFVPFELTYEILYDLRDLEGDREAGVPTYPVVHGAERSRQIIDGLLLGSVVPLLVGFALGWFGVRELLFLAAPAIQFWFYRPRLKRGLTSADCILVTHLGSALLIFFLIGTRIWLRLGGPANIVW